MSFLGDIRSDYELCHSDNAAYQAKVAGISSLLKLKGDTRLMPELLPTYLIGDFDRKAAIVLVSLNPAYHKGPTEEEMKHKNTWEGYIDFTKSAFTYFKAEKMKLAFFATLSHLFSGIDHEAFLKHRDKYDYCQDRIINTDLIPYYSKRMSLPDKPSYSQHKYLSGRLDWILGLVEERSASILIFNGKPYSDLLDRKGFLKEENSRALNDRNKMYCFRYKQTQCLHFSRFLGQGGASKDNMEKDIPRIMKEFFGRNGHGQP